MFLYSQEKGKCHLNLCQLDAEEGQANLCHNPLKWYFRGFFRSFLLFLCLCRCNSSLHYQHISILLGTVHHTSYCLLFFGEMANEPLLIFLICQDSSFLDRVSLSPVKCTVTPEPAPVLLKCVAYSVEGSFCNHQKQ